MNNTKRRKRLKPVSFFPPTPSSLPPQTGSRTSEMPRVLTLRLSRQIGRWRSWHREHEIWPCENSFCKCRGSRHGLNLAALLQAAYCSFGTTMSWNKSQLGSRISSRHMAPKTKWQSLEATEGLLQKSLAATTKKNNTTYNSLKIQSKSKVCFLVFHTQYCAVYLLQVHFNNISVDPALCPLWLVFNFPQQPIFISWHNKTNRFLALFLSYLCKSLTLNTWYGNDNGIDGLMEWILI